MKKEKYLNYLINLSFFLYFIILIIERSLSVILSLTNGINLFSNGFNTYTYLLVFISIIGFLIYLVIFCRPNIKAIFKYDPNLSYINIIIASGILLLSGMVHTHYTIPIIQFISYGILILGILFKVILNMNNSNNKILLWLSFFYLVSFSMAIPVMYESAIELHTVFHILEAITAIALVFIFTYLFLLIFKEKTDLFLLIPIVIATILDVILIVMRWNETINTFVLIFISLSVILFIIGFIYKQNKN